MDAATRARVSRRRTARLLLRPPEDADLDALACMHADPVVMETLGGVRSEAATATLLEVSREHWRQHGYGYWVAVDRESGRFAGRGGLRRVEIDGRDEVEIGYAFASDFWGRGLATELARESARVAFDELRLEALVCFTLPDNRASRNVMEKVGFGYERDFEWAGLPHVLYRLPAARWRAETAR